MSERAVRAVIVDDEVSARRFLLRLLSNHPEINVQGEAASVEEAVELCGRLKPDVVFLDVQMPRKLGFHLLELLPEKPVIVWVTAHLEYAIKAFEVGSSDYLLKPISRERLAITVARIITVVGARKQAEGRGSFSDAHTNNGTIMLNIKGAMIRLRIQDIALIEPVGAYTKITLVSGGTHVLLKGISSWEKMLPQHGFLRVSRFHLLNRGAVLKFERLDANQSLVHLQGLSAALVLGRRAGVRMLAWLRKEARSSPE